MSTSNKGAGVDTRLQNLTNALFLNPSDDVVVRTHVEGLTLQTGDILIDAVKIWDGSHYVQLEQPNNDGETGGWSISTENYNMVFNGTTWDRMRGNAASGVLVNLSNNTIAVTQGTIPWQISKDANANSNTNPIYTQFINNSLAVTGTFWQATQPVSGTVDVGNFPAFPTSINLGQTTLEALETITVNQGTGGASAWKVDIGNNGTVTADVTFPSIYKISKNTSDNASDNPIYASVTNFPAFPTTIGVTQDTTPWQISKNTNANASNNPIYVNVTNGISTVALDTATLTALETINANVSGSVSITNDTAHPVPIVGNVAITNSGVPITVDFNFEDASVNPMNSLRVASAGVQWWYTPMVDRDSDYKYSEYTTGTNANCTFVQNISAVTITSGSDSSGKVIRNSRRRQKMRPGVSTEIYFAVNFDGPVHNTRKRKGLFTNYNGVFLEMNSDMSLGVRRRLTDGTLVEELIPRIEWNNDRLDGSIDFNPSGLNATSAAKTANITGFVSKTPLVLMGETVYVVVLTVDAMPSGAGIGDKFTITGCTPFNYNQTVVVTAISGTTVTVTYTTDPGVINLSSTGVMTNTFWHFSYSFMIDFIGTRNTIIRWFIITGAGPVLLHAADYTGTLGTQWSNAPALPDRCEVENVGAVTSLPSMTVGGTSISIEAATDLTPRFAIAYNNTGITYNKQTPNLEYAVLGLSIRAGEPYQRADIQLQNIQIIDKSNINPQNAGVFFFRLLLNPTILTNDPASTNIGVTSRQWNYTAATTYSGGIELYAGYASQNAIVDVKTSLNFLNLGTNYDGSNPDKLVLVVKQMVGGVADASIVAMVNFIEAL